MALMLSCIEFFFSVFLLSMLASVDCKHLRETTSLEQAAESFQTAGSARALSVPTIEIMNGVRMPQVCLGMGGSSHSLFKAIHSASNLRHNAGLDRAQAMAELWLKQGGRCFDTAEMYGNEAQVGVAWRGSGVPRQDVFILTKIEPPQQHKKGWTKKRVEKAMRRIDSSYLDLMLIHHPSKNDSINIAMWKELEEFYRSGTLRAIGVANFDSAQLRTLNHSTSIPIALNQRHLNVFHGDDDVLKYCHAHGITYQAYSPLGRAAGLQHQVMSQIAAKYNKTAAQVALRWVLQRGAALTVQSENVEHQLQDMDLFDWALDSMDMIQLNAL